MHNEKLEKEGNIITEKKFKKDVHDINRNIAEVIRDNEEPNNTIKKIIENGMKEYDDIVNMLSNMVSEGKERIVKLLNMLRAATAPISRAELPIKCGSGGCTAPEPLHPRGRGFGGGALSASALYGQFGPTCGRRSCPKHVEELDDYFFAF